MKVHLPGRSGPARPGWILIALLGLTLAACRPPDREFDGPAREEMPRSIGVTRVRLDFVDQPAPAIVAALAERSGLPVAIEESRSRRTPALKFAGLTLQAAEPVPFWEALERVMRPSGLQIRTERGLSDPHEPKLIPLQGVRGPVAIDGAFRCEVLLIDHSRTLALGQEAAPNVQGRPVPTRRGDAGPGVGPTLESFRIQVQIRPEPRPDLKLVSAGEPRVIEATDERGRSLVVPGKELHGMGPYLVTGGIGAFVADLPLAMPDPPGTTLARFKGVAPLVIQTRSSNPLIIPLAGATGRTFDGPGARLTITRVETRGTGATAQTVVELVSGSEARPAPDRPPVGDGIEFLDARGGVALCIRTAREEPPGATRLTFNLPGPAPAQLRYSAAVQANVAVTFGFNDLPLP